MGKIIYLVQGQAQYIKDFLELKRRNDVDTLLLTYDRQIDEALFFPGSTWGEGRNYLLEQAIGLGKSYQYYIFLDDDIVFAEGGYLAFEKQLLELKPAIAVPVFSPKTEKTIMGISILYSNKFIRLASYQVCGFADAQFIAFHEDVIKDRLIVPLQTHFDKLSWHATSSTQQLLMFNFYRNRILQFNKIIVKNGNHRNYIKQQFKDAQSDWLKRQFIKPLMDPRPFAKISKNFFSIKVIFQVLKRSIRDKTFGLIFHIYNVIIHTLMYQPKEKYNIQEDKLLEILKNDSALLEQYRLQRDN